MSANRLTRMLEIAEGTLVPEIPLGFTKPHSMTDFVEYRSYCDDRFNQIYTILNDCTIDEISETKSESLSTIIIVCAQHSEFNSWTTDTSLELSNKILQRILLAKSINDLQQLLIKNNQKLLKAILIKLRPNLLKDTWKNFPAAVAAYAWLLVHIKSPNVDDCVNQVLPTALVLVDDFETSNRILGLNAIKHIIQNATKTELTYCNQDVVIFEAMKPILYFCKSKVVSPLMETYIELMKKFNPQHPFADLKRSKYDDVVSVMLNNMYMEQRSHIQKEFIKYLPSLIKTRGLTIIRQGQILNDILKEYSFEASNCPLVLECLTEILKICWPRKDWIFEMSSKIFLTMIYNYSKHVISYAGNFCFQCQEFATLLTQLCPDEIKDLKEKCKKETISSDFYIHFNLIFSS